MEMAICPPSSLFYIHRSLNSLSAPPTSPSPKLKIKEIESDRFITDAKRQPDKLISVDKNINELQLEAIITRDDNNDNKLEAINPWKANITSESSRIASGSMGVNKLSSLPEEGKRPPARSGKLFDYKPVKGPIVCRNPPPLTPGADLVP